MFCCVLTHNQNDGNGKKFQQTWLSHFFSEGGLGEKRPGSAAGPHKFHTLTKTKNFATPRNGKKGGLRERTSEGFGRVSREKTTTTHSHHHPDRPSLSLSNGCCCGVHYIVLCAMMIMKMT